MTSSSPVGPDDGKEVDWTSDPLMLGLGGTRWWSEWDRLVHGWSWRWNGGGSHSGHRGNRGSNDLSPQVGEQPFIGEVGSSQPTLLTGNAVVVHGMINGGFRCGSVVKGCYSND